MTESGVFSYKSGNSFIHSLPAWIKLLFIPALNIIIFSFGWKIPLALVIAQFFLCFFLRFTLKEQLTDITPVLFYAVCLYAINIITESALSIVIFGKESFSLKQIVIVMKNAFDDRDTAVLLVKFTACVQSASILFKSSTSLELREGIEKIEIFIRRFFPCKKEAVFAEIVSSFINFIPAVFRIWSELKRAWLVRGGTKFLSMYIILLPPLFSECLKYARNSAKAILNRKKQPEATHEQ